MPVTGKIPDILRHGLTTAMQRLSSIITFCTLPYYIGKLAHLLEMYISLVLLTCHKRSM